MTTAVDYRTQAGVDAARAWSDHIQRDGFTDWPLPALDAEAHVQALRVQPPLSLVDYQDYVSSYATTMLELLRVENGVKYANLTLARLDRFLTLEVK